MVNLGEVAELINAQRLRLDLGGDTYIMVQNLFIHIGRIEDRNATTDANVLYTAGKGDNWFTALLVATEPEVIQFNTLSQTDANGDWTQSAWRIVGTARGGGVITFEADGIIREFDVTRDIRGGVKANIFVRIIGDSMSIT